MIEILKNIIIYNYEEYLLEYGSVNRDFFDSDELKIKCQSIFKTSFPKQFDNPGFDFDEKFSIAIKDVRFNYRTTMNPSISIQNDYEDSWLTSSRIADIGWNDDLTKRKTYRGRYLLYLDQKLGRSKSIINETDRSSLEIIKKIGDPKSSSEFFKKGLVVGSVQSGKTSNFNAVVNSSIDIGYKLIIILSGIMEDLRRQTQIRIEKEVEGKMIAQDTFIGVGEVSSFGQLGQYSEVNQVILPTSVNNDFNRTMQQANFSLNNINILVCKKNTSVLQNLLIWLKEYLLENNDKHNIPFLIIDDEADNASINNLGYKGIEYANKINGHIRALLALFNKKTYIGYTATPFANILQDWNKKPVGKWKVKDISNGMDLEFDQEGNLFPDDFIELLIPPSNYIGPKNFFETRIEEVKKIEPLISPPITDYIDFFPERVEILPDGSIVGIKKINNEKEFENDENAKLRFDSYSDYKEHTRSTTKYDDYPKDLPKSLDEAIKCFIIAIAVRLNRRPKLIQSRLFHPHNTMLIHISRFSDWQCKTKKLIIDKIEELVYQLNNHNLDSEDSIFKEFERIWIKYFAYPIANIREYLPSNYDDQYLTPITYFDVRQLLVKAIDGIEVKAVNTISKDELDYENGEKKYIVIGGNKLSRGFTLEGLTINYFIRNTNFADTLLQMGRWFGYRPGYLDCCKLFTTFNTLEKYDQCTWTIEELEEEFRKLSVAKKKPKDYATKVLTHPGTLQITRPAVLKNAIVEKWSFEDKLVQTTELKIKKIELEKSWYNFKNIIQKHKHKFTYDTKNNVISLNTDTSGWIEFLDTQLTFTDKFLKNELVRFVKLANSYKKITNWKIAIKTTGGSTNKLSPQDTGLNEEIQLTLRSSSSREKYFSNLLDQNIFKVSGSSSNILSGGTDMSFTLTDDKISEIQNNYKKNNIGKNPPENEFREKMNDSDGLMVVYLMDLRAIFDNPKLDDDSKEKLRQKAINENIDLTIPLIGFAIGIPPIHVNIGGEYLLNKHILENIRNTPEDEDSLDGINEEEVEDEILILNQ